MTHYASTPNYLNDSSKWPVRLYKRAEVCQMLRISLQTFYKLQKAGYLKPFTRRDGKRTPTQKGLTFYTDQEVFKAILFLFPDIAAEDIKAIEVALLRNTADYTGDNK